MWQTRLQMVLAALVCCVPVVAAADNLDDIDKRVHDGRAAYIAESNAIVAEIHKEIDAKEEMERDRANPNLDRIKSLKADRERLDEDGKYPTWVAAKFKARQLKNSGTLMSVLNEARRDYVRAKGDDKAESLTAEIERLRTDGSSLPGNSTSGSADGPAPAVMPFDVKRAKQLQLNWARHLKVGAESTNSVGMKFVLIPPGEFMMGSAITEPGRRPDETPHRVRLTKPLLVGAYEVTQDQYQKVMGSNPSDQKEGSNPVTHVSWNDAMAFCEKLSQLPKEIEGRKVYRLPTEAEWENACRAGSTTRFSFGDVRLIDQYGWSGRNSGMSIIELTEEQYEANPAEFAKRIGSNKCQHHRVGRLKPNAWGLFDMHGNVAEWCSDWYGEYPPETVVNPTGPDGGTQRTVRGGNWFDAPNFLLTARRGRSEPHASYNNRGFRVVCEISDANTK